jgi:predicted dehydrogenase
VHKKLNLENRPIAFGLVGAGRIAQTYVEAFQTTSLAKLVAVTDNRPEAAAALAETCKVATVPSA